MELNKDYIEPGRITLDSPSFDYQHLSIGPEVTTLSIELSNAGATYNPDPICFKTAETFNPSTRGSVRNSGFAKIQAALPQYFDQATLVSGATYVLNKNVTVQGINLTAVQTFQLTEISVNAITGQALIVVSFFHNNKNHSRQVWSGPVTELFTATTINNIRSQVLTKLKTLSQFNLAQ